MSVRKAAARAGVSPQYIRRMLRRGALRGFRIGKAWAVEEAGLQEWLEGRIAAGRPGPGQAANTPWTPASGQSVSRPPQQGEAS